MFLYHVGLNLMNYFRLIMLLVRYLEIWGSVVLACLCDLIMGINCQDILNFCFHALGCCHKIEATLKFLNYFGMILFLYKY